MIINWKTSVIGLVSIIMAGLVSQKYLTADQAAIISGLLLGLLGLVSKDGDVTGGTRSQ